ncbi:MAG: hypothetical protein NTX72_03405 [Candidatus Uhrbacteria bacterium]|nr:hypothetical protein [Candidatus Uhrbacteria bacterium]
MDETQLSAVTLLELGLSIPHVQEISPELSGRKSAYLPAIPDSVPGANRLIADAINRAALVDPNPNREAARSDMRARLVRELNGRAHIANLIFEGREQPNGDVHVFAKATLPGYDAEQEIVPLIYVGPEYLIAIENGKYTSGGSIQCLVFKSNTKTGPFKAFPLGLADPSTIHVWNDVAKRRNAVTKNKDELWPLIEVIRNNLMRPGVRVVEFIPTFDPLFKRERGSRKRLLIGTRFGQKLFLSSKSQIPEPDDVDGEKRFVSKHIFRVKLNEGPLEVFWLGPEGKVKIDQRLAVLDVHDAINPYAVLNTSPLKVDWKTIDQTARGYLNRAFDHRNPLYLAGIEMKLIFPSDPQQTMHAILEDLMLDAIKQIKLQISAASVQMIRMLTIAPNKPTAEAMLGGRDIRVAALRMNQPEDAASLWISRVLDMPFDPKSPLLMHLRSWLINSYGRVTPPPIPEISQVSILIPELTPVPKQIPISSLPVSHRESSSPAFRASDAFVPMPKPTAVPHTADEEIILGDDDLEEFIEAEATTVDLIVDEELPFVDPTVWDPTGMNGVIPPAGEDDPGPPMRVNHGSILNRGEYKVAYRTDKQ